MVGMSLELIDLLTCTSIYDASRFYRGKVNMLQITELREAALV